MRDTARPPYTKVSGINVQRLPHIEYFTTVLSKGKATIELQPCIPCALHCNIFIGEYWIFSYSSSRRKLYDTIVVSLLTPLPFNSSAAQTTKCMSRAFLHSLWFFLPIGAVLACRIVGFTGEWIDHDWREAFRVLYVRHSQASLQKCEWQ